MNSPKWKLQARCLGELTRVFFPHDTLADDRWDLARGICSRCRVRRECLEWALSYDEHDDRWGMFGGMTPGERHKERDRRRGNERSAS